MNAAETWVALVHHPVYDRNRRVVATALTNLDLHDIARSTRTYGLAGFLIVHPVAAQRELAERIAGHWLTEGAEKNDFRRMAIERVAVVDSVESAVRHVEARAGRRPLIVGTAARPSPAALTYGAFRARAAEPALLLFGTGWGLTDELLGGCDVRLAPIAAGSDYNHLSVRSACAIILDRLYGDRED
jgi:hypothetical protein